MRRPEGEQPGSSLQVVLSVPLSHCPSASHVTPAGSSLLALAPVSWLQNKEIKDRSILKIFRENNKLSFQNVYGKNNIFSISINNIISHQVSVYLIRFSYFEMIALSFITSFMIGLFFIILALFAN